MVLKRTAEPIKQYTNKQQIPSMLSDEALKNLTGLTRENIYYFHDNTRSYQGYP